MRVFQSSLRSLQSSKAYIFQEGAEEREVSMGDYMAYTTDVCVKISIAFWKRDEENV